MEEIRIMAGKKVLPVEDEAAIRQMAVMASERAGFQVTEVGHDEQAERPLADGLPDLILLDRMLLNAVMAISSSRGRRKRWRRCGAGQRRSGWYAAVEEGRTIFSNIRKFLHYLQLSNIG
jgi:hypothetical protein